jgi:hypothetical protein
LQNHHSLIALAVLATLTSIPAHADTDLTGKWVGTFSGVQVEFPAQRGPFGHVSDDGKRGQSEHRFVDNPLQLDVETQKNGLAVGTWNAGEFRQKFVCAQVSPSVWNCVDAGGRASLEIKSATELKVCYLDNREGAQGAGCGVLRRAQ